MDYKQVAEWFHAKERVITLGLERMRRACLHFGSVERSFPCVHVGGTNGKGSTCLKMAHVLSCAGYKVGLYTSPHIHSMCERIQINQEPIPETDLARLVTLVKDYDATLSSFEVLTIVAFLWYRENAVDLAVLEVGLGGTLDATNVCWPELCVITSISYDHQEYLGDTLESIAENKAGIIKKNVPVVIGPRVPRAIIERKAEKENASLYAVEGDFSDYDEENSRVACCALALLEKKWPHSDVEKVYSIRPPCRFERVSSSLAQAKYGNNAPPIILDVAHNPDAIDKLLEKLQGRAVFLCSVSRDKDVLRMMRSLLKQAEGVVCTQASGERAMLAHDLGKIALDLKPSSPVGIEHDVGRALLMALDLAVKKKVSLVATGTFYFMSTIKTLLGNVE